MSRTIRVTLHWKSSTIFTTATGHHVFLLDRAIERSEVVSFVERQE
jgi:hypothetical protein